MIVLMSVLPFPLSNRLPTQTHNPNSHQRFPSSFTFPTSFPNKTVVFGINPSDSKDPSFFDENGVVNDMEGYLNHLSLEYDSVWDTKPSWCQPWTIALTGLAVIAISWYLLDFSQRLLVCLGNEASILVYVVICSGIFRDDC
ncbi:uncharacterized protein LOC106757144 isoform X2 [Vigna radiata var. radiata]|uniref:Uncharacterized protein LOC106757144 isoform X2 n=1 Tax=Vigna radiata var. radiata TaxID=3916 RepID=A0A3Q0EUJ7_VIGRR|nr:uncharacterized protein LOC106757144 isoform X2 [Vigna radiata var. radiata]